MPTGLPTGVPSGPGHAPRARLLGAARVSVMWLVMSLALMVICVVLWLSSQSDVAHKIEDLTRVTEEKATAGEQLAQAEQYRRSLSQAAGWYDRSSADPSTNIEALQQAFTDFKAAFPDMAAASDLEQALPIAMQAHAKGAREAADLKARVEGLRSEIDGARQALAQVTGDKDKQIDALNKRLADETANASQLQRELQGRLDRALAQARDADAEKRALQKQMEDSGRESTRTAQRYEARIDQLASLSAFTQAPVSDLPDARVLEVSESLGLAWIDVGSKQRLTRGARFRVESSTPGARRQKAWAEVIEVAPDMAQVKLVELVDRFDPVVRGDVLVNPLFDREGGRNAVLVGRFSGTYNEKDLRALLDRIGIHVQDKLDLTTSYLIVGSEIWTDEFGEPLEAPLQPSELPAYKEAESLGVQVIPLQDLRTYFKL